MPGALLGAVPAGLFPVTLSRKFTPSQAVLMRMNDYHDGSNQRQALVTESRRSWKLTKRLDQTLMQELRSFWEQNEHRAFNFYDPFETVPPFSPTPAGTPDGLYVVRFASDWDQTIDMVRGEASIELVELRLTPISEPPPVPPPPPVITPPPPPPPPPKPVGAFLTVTSAFRTDPALFPKGFISIVSGTTFFGGVPLLWSSADWDVRTDRFNVTISTYPDPLTSPAGIAELHVFFSIANGDGRGPGNATFDIYDVFLTVTQSDQTSRDYRPQSQQFHPNSGTGSIVAAGNAIDGNPNTFARIHGTDWFPLNVPPDLEVLAFA